MKKFFKIIAVTVVVFIIGFFSYGIVKRMMTVPPAPSLEQPVVDMTGTLTISDISQISKIIHNQDEDDYAQIAVLMVHNLPLGKSIEKASLDTARSWNIGSKNDKNGVLLYIVKDDRELRIEVADGASPYLTDSESSRIIQDVITPYFKQGEYTKGIEAGVRNIRAEVDGEEGKTYINLENEADEDIPNNLLTLEYLIVLFFIVALVAMEFMGRFIILIVSALFGVDLRDIGSGDSGDGGDSSSGSSFGGGGGFSGGGSSGSW